MNVRCGVRLGGLLLVVVIVAGAGLFFLVRSAQRGGPPPPVEVEKRETREVTAEKAEKTPEARRVETPVNVECGSLTLPPGWQSPGDLSLGCNVSGILTGTVTVQADGVPPREQRFSDGQFSLPMENLINRSFDLRVHGPEREGNATCTSTTDPEEAGLRVEVSCTSPQGSTQATARVPMKVAVACPGSGVVVTGAPFSCDTNLSQGRFRVQGESNKELTPWQPLEVDEAGMFAVSTTGWPPGTQRAQVEVQNSWGVSASTPFTLTVLPGLEDRPPVDPVSCAEPGGPPPSGAFFPYGNVLRVVTLRDEDALRVYIELDGPPPPGLGPLLFGMIMQGEGAEASPLMSFSASATEVQVEEMTGAEGYWLSPRWLVLVLPGDFGSQPGWLFWGGPSELCDVTDPVQPPAEPLPLPRPSVYTTTVQGPLMLPDSSQDVFDRNTGEPYGESGPVDLEEVTLVAENGKLVVRPKQAQPFSDEWSRAVEVNVLTPEAQQSCLNQMHAGQPTVTENVRQEPDGGMACVFDMPSGFPVLLVVETYQMTTPDSPWLGDLYFLQLAHPWDLWVLQLPPYMP